MRYVIGACLTALLFGCDAPSEETTQASAGGCNAEAYQYLKWQERSVLDTIELPEGTRIITPGMNITMDFRPERLNFYIGKTDRIEAIRCG